MASAPGCNRPAAATDERRARSWQSDGTLHSAGSATGAIDSVSITVQKSSVARRTTVNIVNQGFRRGSRLSA